MADSILVRIAACALAVLFGSCVVDANAAPGDKRQKLLEEFDADGDGKISPAEAAKIRKANAEKKRGEARRGAGAQGQESSGTRRAGEGSPGRGGFRAVITMGGREMVFNDPREAMAALARIMGAQGRGPGRPGFEGRGGGPRGEGFGRGLGGPGPRGGEGFGAPGRNGPSGGAQGRGRGGPGGERQKRDR
ncbi:MAG: hypothetical protein MI757_04885 [Pirellulales bacterium]|nr:hypothetical protein [Pirellulales bacterium]